MTTRESGHWCFSCQEVRGSKGSEITGICSYIAKISVFHCNIFCSEIRQKVGLQLADIDFYR